MSNSIMSFHYIYIYICFIFIYSGQLDIFEFRHAGETSASFSKDLWPFPRLWACTFSKVMGCSFSKESGHAFSKAFAVSFSKELLPLDYWIRLSK